MKDERKSELDRTDHPELGALWELGRSLEVAQEALAAVCGVSYVADERRWPSAEEAYAEGMLHLIGALGSFLGEYEDCLRRLDEWRRREPPEEPSDDAAPSAEEIPF